MSWEIYILSNYIISISRINMLEKICDERAVYRPPESGGRYTTIHLIGLEPTLRREKITNSALGVIVCLVEIMVICDL